MDYYEPTLLFRQNAIRRSAYNSNFNSNSLLNVPEYTPTSSNWLLNANNNDTEILNKVACLNRLNIKSNYWKIPDNEMNLTSMASKSLGEENALMAISSGSKQNNLFLYELNLETNYLTHHNTISLPNIHSMKWVPQSSNLLMTGNNKGYGHLISTPGIDDDESAEILKRFNHRKHLKSINKDTSITKHASTMIEKMNFLNRDKLISIYDDNLFNWDLNDATSSCKPRPTSITSINGLLNFDINSKDSNLLALVGKFGISLFDVRDPKFSIPESSKNIKKKSTLTSNIIRWNPQNEYVFASGHLDSVVRLWDIRKQESFAELNGHTNRVINSLEWVEGDLFSGGKDGNIIHWDLTTDLTSQDQLLNCGLKEGLNSVNYSRLNNMDIINQRQCGTILPASNSNIIQLETFQTFEDLKVLSIDGSSFFGLHSKIVDAVLPESKGFYSRDDLNMMIASSETLVETEPLKLRKEVDVPAIDIESESLVSESQSLSSESQSVDSEPQSIDSEPELIDLEEFETNSQDLQFTEDEAAEDVQSIDELQFTDKDFTLTEEEIFTEEEVFSDLEPFMYTPISYKPTMNMSDYSLNQSTDSLGEFDFFDTPNSTRTDITEIDNINDTLDPIKHHKYQLLEVKFDDFTFANFT